MKIKYYLIKFKILGIIISIVCIISLYITYTFLGIMKINSGIITFGELDISESNKTLDLFNEDIHIVGKIKSGYIDNKRIYFLYYYPFSILNNSKYPDVYDKFIIEKKIRDFQYEPYYAIYNRDNNIFTYLNAEKKVLEGNINDVNMDYLKILDKSKNVNIDSINFETNFDITSIKNKEYKKLIEDLNQYLNLQINK